MSLGYEGRRLWKPHLDKAETVRELFLAIDIQDFSKFQQLIQRTEAGSSAIAQCFEYLCKKNDCTNFAKILLNSSTNPNQISVLGKKPIHLAAESGNAVILEILLNDPRVDVNTEDIRGWTALHYVVKKQVIDQSDVEKIRRCLRVLLKHNFINVNKRCTNVYDTGATALHLAAGAGRDVALAALLRDKRINVNVVDEAGKTALHYAAAQHDRKKEHSNIIKISIELLLGRSDIDLNKHDSMGRTPLHVASQGNNYTAFEILLTDSRININRVDNAGKTVLHYEAGKSDRNPTRRAQMERILSILLNPRKSCDINKEDGNGRAPIHEAAERGNLVVLKALLLDNRIDVNLRDWNGRTVLHCIAERNDNDPDRVENMNNCISLLLDGTEKQFDTTSTILPQDDTNRYQLDIDATDILGETALQKASLTRNQHLILTLLRRGASIRTKSAGESVLEGIAPSTLEGFLDECIEDNKLSLHSADYALTFNYRFLSEGIKKVQTPETEALLYMSQSRKLKHLLKHPVISTFIDLKWKRVQAIYYINVLIYTFFLIFLNSYVIFLTSYKDSNCENVREVPLFLWIPFLCLFGYICLRELFELLTYPCNYIRSLENYIELGLISIVGVLILGEGSWKTCEVNRVLLVVSLLLCWFEWVLLTGRLPFLSVQVQMLKTVSVTFLTFMAWYSFIIIAFAISFYTLFHEDSTSGQGEDGVVPPFENIASSIFKTIIMMSGEFDADSIPFYNAANVASHLVFVFFVLLIAMVMLNLLNGLAVNDTQAIKKQALILGQISRVKSIFYIESITLLDTSTNNCIRNKILCSFPFVSMQRIFKKASFFANINNEMKVYVIPNRGCRISYMKPIQTGRPSTGIVQYKFAKMFKWFYAHIDTKIVKSALEIITRQKSDVDVPTENHAENLKEQIEQCKQRLDNMETKLDTILQIVKTFSEQRRFQTDA
ncbi:hypothetical protein C0J52_11915 [Blattella germanica]|nr:hypothetical protein C0J52_11915 [Blattella germanica]